MSMQIFGSSNLGLLVRHADIEDGSANDPSLSNAGKRRANELVKVVGLFATDGRRVKAVYASEMRRTQETVRLLSSASGIRVTVVEANRTEELARLIHSVTDGIVVVSGHSNTLPTLIQALGCSSAVHISELEFDKLFIIDQIGSSTPECTVLKYGDSGNS